MSDKLIVHLFDLTKDSQGPIADCTVMAKVVHLAWNPHENSSFVTVGKDHMYIFTYDDDT